MIEKSTLDFLQKLKKNNNKAWMDANKKQYENAKENFNNFTQTIIDKLALIDSAYGQLKPNNCVFRLHRDVRFSKNKDPYKTNFGAGFTIGGKKSNLAGFYIHIEPNSCFVGGGKWMLEPEELRKIRQEIDYNYKEFKKIVENKNFVACYNTLSREQVLVNPPKNYTSDNDAVEYLKLKNYVTSVPIADKMVLDKGYAGMVIANFKTLLPLMQFLNTAIVA